jgi:hypothetical protein
VEQVHRFAVIPRPVKNVSMAVNIFSYCARVKGKCPAPGTVTKFLDNPGTLQRLVKPN